MYSNAFDTVKTKNIDLISCEGLLYSSILSGLHPTLSLNQAIDSTVLINIINNDSDFLRFIENGYIKFALYGKYKGKNRELEAFLIDKLKDCIEEDKPSFRFSSMSFLYERDYTEKQLLEVYKAIGQNISGDKIFVTRSKIRTYGIKSEDIDEIEKYLKTIMSIEDAVKGKYILPPNNITKCVETLHDKLNGDIESYVNEIENDEFKICLKEFQKLLQKEYKQSKDKVNSRSYIYNLIARLQCSKAIEEEIKAIVDLCYNEVVAASIVDNEDDIMINNSNYEYAQIWSNNIDNDDDVDKNEQKLSLTRIARGSDITNLSWGLVDEILTNAKPNKNNPQQWYEDMQDYCKKLGMQEIKFGMRKIFTGSMYFGIKALSQALLSQITSDIAPDTMRDDIVGKIISGIITDAIPKPNHTSINQELDEIRKKKDTIYHLTTQTALLKRDYGRNKNIDAGEK